MTLLNPLPDEGMKNLSLSPRSNLIQAPSSESNPARVCDRGCVPAGIVAGLKSRSAPEGLNPSGHLIFPGEDNVSSQGSSDGTAVPKRNPWMKWNRDLTIYGWRGNCREIDPQVVVNGPIRYPSSNTLRAVSNQIIERRRS